MTTEFLHWFGVGGQGKTALMEEFERILRRRHEIARGLSTTRPGFALIDFDNPANRAIATALLSIREQLSKTAGVRFPTFEFACLRYLMMTTPGVNIKDLRARFFSTGSEFLDALVQALNTAGEFGGAMHLLPGFTLISKYGSKLVGRAGHAVHSWWNRRGIRLAESIEKLSQDALLRKLPSYLGLDLMDALAEKQPPPLVIMLDTYEALWRGHGLKDGPGALRIDDWVRLLVQDARGVLFVIAGRDELRWREIKADWAKIIEKHPLTGLTRPDADKLLSKWQVAEAEIRTPMIEGARSREFGELDPTNNTAEAYLPFYLELQARTYGNIKANGETPKPEDFGGEQPEILARFLEHLDSETDKLLRVASYPATLDPTLLDMLAERFLGGRASADWSRVYARSLVSEERDGTRFLHDLLRRALQERERQERLDLYHDIHRVLFEWFDSRCGPNEATAITQEHERAFLAALRHLSRVDEGEAVRWANGQMERFDNAARWRALEEAGMMVQPLAERAFGQENTWTTANLAWLAGALKSNGRYAEAEQFYERVRTIEEKTLGPEHPSAATTLHELARVYSDTGRYAEAEQLFERVRTIYEKTLGPEHPSTLATLSNLAGVYNHTSRYAEAERLLERARAIHEETLGPEHPSTAATLANLAAAYLNTGRYADSERLYKRVQAINEKILGPEHPNTAATLNNLANVYLDTGRYPDAERLLERARAIDEETLGPEHPSIATTLHNLAGVYRDTGRYAEAEQLFERVRTIYEKTLGPEHPSTATTLHELARVYSNTGRYAEAEQLFERARMIHEKALGPEHPSIATTLHNLAGVYRDTGRYAEAEQLYERARMIHEKALGPEHPSTAATLGNLAGVYRDTGRYTDAERLFATALHALTKKLPSHHPRIGRLLVGRGRLLALCDREADARRDFAQALGIFETAGVRPEERWAREAREALAALEPI